MGEAMRSGRISHEWRKPIWWLGLRATRGKIETNKLADVLALDASGGVRPRQALGAALKRRPEQRAWSKATAVDTPSAYREFLERWPTSTFIVDAKARLQRLEDTHWAAASSAGTVAAFEAFAAAWPESTRSDFLVNLEHLLVRMEPTRASGLRILTGITSILGGISITAGEAFILNWSL